MLSTLSLSKNSKIQSLCFLEYLQSPILRLDLSTCRLTAESLVLLGAHSVCQNLLELELSYNQSTDSLDFPALFCRSPAF